MKFAAPLVAFVAQPARAATPPAAEAWRQAGEKAALTLPVDGEGFDLKLGGPLVAHQADRLVNQPLFLLRHRAGRTCHGTIDTGLPIYNRHSPARSGITNRQH